MSNQPKSDPSDLSRPQVSELLLAVRRKIQERIAVSQDAAFAAATAGNQGIADFHGGCVAMGLCLVEDLDELERSPAATSADHAPDADQDRSRDGRVTATTGEA